MKHADKLDNATELAERERAHSEKNFKRPNHGLLPTGLCRWCEEELDNEHDIFCCEKCKVRWSNQ